MGKFLMMPLHWARRHAKVVAGVVAGLVIGGAGSAVVMASIPDSAGVIHACYTTTGQGKFHIIDTSTQTCAANETALAWNQTGPQGPAGPTGSQGPQGQQGPAGAAGPGALVANLVGANFSNASLQYHNLAGLDMHNAIFDSAYLNGSDMHGANLSGAQFGGQMHMISVDAHGSNFSNANFRVGSRFSDFEDANFSGSNFSGAIITWFSSPMTEANLSNANFTGANISNTTFYGVNFTGSDLSAAALDTGSISWVNTTCPDGTNSDSDGNTCIGHLAP